MGERSLCIGGLIIFGVIFLILFLLAGKSRRLVLVSALGAAPFGLLGFVFYSVWYPGRITNGMVGIEDFLFCFFSGGISLALISLFLDFSVFGFSLSFKFLRIFFSGIIGAGFMLLLYFIHIRNYLNSYLSMAFMILLLIGLQKGLWKVFVVGSSALLVIYSAAMMIDFILWPDLISLWKKENLSGIFLSGVPFEELIWAFLFGGTWPVIFLYAMGPKGANYQWKSITYKNKA